MPDKPIRHRYDFLYYFDVADGNPNGDPDAGNLPRIDPETGHGLVTDVCTKRKIRNFVEIASEGKDRFHIFVRERAVLNNSIERAYHESQAVKDSLAAWEKWKADKKSKKKDKSEKPARHYEDIAADWMCDNFFDIRTFGAVLSTGDDKVVEGVASKIKMSAGQVRGPLQFSIARSIDPVLTQEFALTRCAVTNERDLEKERTIGRKFALPYALFRQAGYLNPLLAARTGFSESDLELLKQALDQMFEYDRSAARGNMAPRACIAFKHENKLGNARADQLFELVKCKRTDAVEVNGRAPRSFADYELTVDEDGLPEGVTVERWV